MTPCSASGERCTRPGGRALLAFAGEAAARRAARARRARVRRLPRRPDPGRGCRRPGPPLDRARDRLVRDRGHRGGSRRPADGPLAPSFDAFGWHSYEFSLPPDAIPLAGSETCYNLSGSATTPTASNSTPRSRPPTPSPGSATTTRTPTPSRPASTRQALVGKPNPSWRHGTPGRIPGHPLAHHDLKPPRGLTPLTPRRRPR